MTQLHYLSALLKFAFKENPLLWLSTALAVFSVFVELAAMTLLLPMSKIAAGRGGGTDDTIGQLLQAIGIASTGRNLLLVFLSLLGVRSVTQLASQGTISYYGKQVLAQLVSRAFTTVVRDATLRDIQSKSMGSFVSMMGDECFRASTLVISISQCLSLILLSGLYFLAIAVYSPIVAVGVVVFLTVSLLAMAESLRMSHRLGTLQIEQSKAHNSVFLDSLNSLKTVRALSAEQYVASRYSAMIYEYSKTLFRIDFINTLTQSVPVIVLVLGVSLLVTYTSFSDRIDVSLPFILTITILLMRFFPAAGQLLNLGLRIIADSKAGRDVTSLISAYKGDEITFPKIDASRTISCVEIRNAHFAHEQGKDLLRDLNLRIEKGNSYALIGLSGSGKSTVLDLLMGFYPLTEGDIVVNGILVADPSRSALRGQVLLVSQESAIFNDTVANNIRFGTEASLEEIEHACRIACIDDFIRSLPLGYNTLLSYQGNNMSGGQRQRLGISRAVLRCPQVLLLDESTSALDAETKISVVNNLTKEFADRILVYVTHDPYVIGAVNKILDMELINQITPQPTSMKSWDQGH